MKPDYISAEYLHDLVERALQEDLGEGDHTSLASIPLNMTDKAKVLAKEGGIVAGIELAKLVFKKVDHGIFCSAFKKDGELVKKGDLILEIQGPARSILAGERLMLNFMQRMSGIATYTQKMVKLVEGTKTRILDTRKTTPNLRLLEKWAVLMGGGMNHRLGLYDMIMLKDNHIDFAGGIPNAIRQTQAYLHKTGKKLRIEIETRNIAEVEEVMQTGGVDVVMLDNMDPETMKEAIRMIGGKFETEASGGITEKYQGSGFNRSGLYFGGFTHPFS